MAKEKELDLVEISSKADFSICKIIDYSKFKYQEKKRQKLIKANTKKVIVKELKLDPNIHEHDIEFKTRHAIKFLQDKAKVIISMYFRGRQIKFTQKGIEKLEKITKALAPYGKPVEAKPKIERKRIVMHIEPLNVRKN